jgi:hypothetical protein
VRESLLTELMVREEEEVEEEKEEEREEEGDEEMAR